VLSPDTDRSGQNADMTTLIRLIGAALAFVLVALVLSVAALVLFVSLTIDLSPYKALIASKVKSRTGLVLEVAGPFYAQTGPVLGVRASDVRIRSASETRSADVLSAVHVALEVATLPLLSGVLEPRLLEIESARLHLERDARGRRNWDPRDVEAVTFGAEEGDGVRLVADRLRLRVHDLGIDYADAASADRLRVRLQSADVEPTAGGLHIALEATVNDHPLRLKGTTATLNQLIGRDDPIPINLEGELLGLSLKVKRKLVDPRTGDEMAAELRVRGDSLGISVLLWSRSRRGGCYAPSRI
jgi:uncharacterized protein involved in outer membrane biogenesis